MKVHIATCQHPVSGSLQRNCDVMLRLLENSADEGAHIAHFCECGLGGYAGVDIPNFGRYDWEKDLQCKRILAEQARSQRLWLAFGGNHFLSDNAHPRGVLLITQVIALLPGAEPVWTVRGAFRGDVVVDWAVAVEDSRSGDASKTVTNSSISSSASRFSSVDAYARWGNFDGYFQEFPLA